MIVKLKAEGGLAAPGKQSNGKPANLIADRFNTLNKVETTYLPYFNGWEDGKYYCVTDDYQHQNIESPYLTNILLTDEKIDTTHVLYIVFNTIKNNADINALILFILMIYGVLYSVFSEKDYRINRIINLSGKMADKAGQFMKVFNKNNKDFIGLNSNLSAIKKAVFNAKDMPIIFKGRPDSKVYELIDIYYNNMNEIINVNGKHFSIKPQALCVIISNLLSGVVSPDIIWEFNIEDWNGDIDAPAFGVAVKYLIKQAEKYVKENRFHEIIKSHFEQLPDDFNESDSRKSFN